MKFYQSIAKYYDHIFPGNPMQVEFVASGMENPEKCKELEILDIGCGTGNLSFGLAERFGEVTGIDLDSEMLEMARDKAVELGKDISFINLNMLELNERFGPDYFDCIASFGNTMVHLDTLKDVEEFLKGAKDILKAGGKLFIQIINYDRILDRKIEGLPTIENEHIKFERFYRYDEENHKVAFRTLLTVKEENLQIENEINLMPIRKNELEHILEKCGFEDIKFFGGFTGAELTMESIPLIVECRK